jgi:hypothetical protein
MKRLPQLAAVLFLAFTLALPGHSAVAVTVTMSQVPAPAAVATSVAQLPIMAAAIPTPDPFRILVLGDSISINNAWPTELCRLMAQDAGITCDIRNPSVSGVGCDYWPSRISGLLNTNHPHAVALFCGTNNVGTSSSGLNTLGAAFRMTVEATYTFQANPRITILPSFIQYSDVLTLPDNVRWLINSEPNVNDELYRNMQYYQPSGWFPAGIADFQQIPGTAQFMDEECPGCAGIHPNALGYKAMGRIVYDRFASAYGWPASSEPPVCNMYGHRLAYGPPATYVHC